MRICEITGCNEKHVSRGYCRTHYYRFKRYGNPLEVREIQSKHGNGSCKVDGCEKVHQGHGYCKMHLYRFKKYGDPLIIQTFPEFCEVKGCEKEHFGHGYCRIHWGRWKRHGDPLKTLIEYNKPCSVEDCEKTSRRYGHCEKHQNKSEIYVERHRLYSSKRRMLHEKSLQNDFNHDDWIEALKYFYNKCAYCGVSSNNMEHDHVVPVSKSGAHTKTNIVPACKSCNRSKRARYLYEWFPYQEFYDRDREDKIHKWQGYEVTEPIQIKLF